MKLLKKALQAIFVLMLLSVFVSCNGQSNPTEKFTNKQAASINLGDTVAEIGKNIRCIFQDSKNDFWFATDGEGAFRYDGKTIWQLTEKQGLLSKFVWNIQQASDGTMWFNTRGGAGTFGSKQFNINQSIENLSSTNDFSNAMLLSGYYYQNKTLKKFQLPQTSLLTDKYSTTPYAVYCSFRDRKGNIWFGTESRGVCKYDGKSFTWLDNKELGVPVRTIFEDKIGNIWIGNNGYGLFHYDGKKLTNFTKEHQLENPPFLKGLKGKAGTLARVWAITEDKQGNLWIGTIDAGLWKFDGQVLTNYTTKDGLPSNSIGAVYCDNNGRLWIGASENGIAIYDGKIFAAFKKQH